MFHAIYRDALVLKLILLFDFQAEPLEVPQAIAPIPTHFFVMRSLVCRLSSVCHIRARRLHRLTGLDASWHVSSRGQVTH